MCLFPWVPSERMKERNKERKFTVRMFKALEEIRNNAYLNTKIAKERSKKWHDQLITRKNFKEGDQVLLYDSKLHLFLGKLKSRWTGSFTVQQAYPNGSVDLRDPNDDRLFKVNG